ncbi:DUF4262 domain-containing protein [Flavobacterium pectinovorum]|uniref:DUF4262 domain-containing protein n=1 Tax=Flavobacterium pectinovorum TaxID=29533 RepID=UPI00265ED0DE|nr:DUF4262 domain-containing protein [Flavobacterium pectinovorum]WKL46554.1 DUF4262 domain-containing protein [Flavobacterium pectinovorum]
MDINDEKKELYFKEVYDNIKNIGYHTTAVLEAEHFTPFAYSTGIFENFNIPELFISGLGPNLSGEIIKNYVKKYKFKQVPLNKKIDDLIHQFPICFIMVNNEDLKEYTLTSIKFYENQNYEYLQLVFPDLNRNFPNEPNYNYDQKIVGKLEIQ